MKSMIWKTNQPKQPKVYKVNKADIAIYRENMSSITQLLAYSSNVIELTDIQEKDELKENVKNAIKFMDDMRFLFLRFSEADAIKIEK